MRIKWFISKEGGGVDNKPLQNDDVAKRLELSLNLGTCSVTQHKIFGLSKLDFFKNKD